MTIPVVTGFTTYPNRGDVNFASKADVHVTEEDAFVTEINASIAEINTNLPRIDQAYVNSATSACSVWVTATPYTSPQLCAGSDGHSYRCHTNHTSGASTEPNVGGSWETYWTRISAQSSLDSPAFTGVPTAPTPAIDVNTGQLATTAFVLAQTTNSISTTSSTRIASATAVKAAYDHYPTLSNSISTTSSIVAASATAAKTAYDHYPTMSTSISSTSTTTAANSYAAKLAYDHYPTMSTSISSTSTTIAANSYAVRTAYNMGNHSHPYAATSHTHTAEPTVVGGYCLAVAEGKGYLGTVAGSALKIAGLQAASESATTYSKRASSYQSSGTYRCQSYSASRSGCVDVCLYQRIA